MAVICDACSQQVGPPDQSVHDPQKGLENPDAHLKVRDGDKGRRVYCSETGQITEVVTDSGDTVLTATGDMPKAGGGSGGGQKNRNSSPKSESRGESRGPPEPSSSGDDTERNEDQPVYEIDEDKDAMDVLLDVVTNPSYELSDTQIEEVQDWADIYDGQIPPDTLQEVLGSFSGVSKQRAKLVRQKYEAKLNKWVREKSRGDTGPPIGAIHAPNTSMRGGGSTATGPSPSEIQRKLQQKKRESESGDQEDSAGRGRRRGRGTESSSGRTKRKQRRQKVADTVAEEVAQEMAREMASNVGRGYDFMFTLLESKAKKDPEWFFEKAEAFDIDIIEDFMEPSDSLKEEIAEESMSQVDQQLDDAVEAVKEREDESPTEPPSRESRGTEPEPSPRQERRPRQEKENDRQRSAPPNTEEGHSEADQEEEEKIEEQTDNEGPHWREGEWKDEDEQFDEIFGEELQQ